MADYSPELVSVVKETLNRILDADGTIEYYLDYRDYGVWNSAEDIAAIAKYLKEANGDIHTAATYAAYDLHDDAMLSMEDDEEDYVRSEIERDLRDYDSEHDTTLLDEYSDLDNEIDGWRDFMEYCGYAGVHIDVEDIFPSEIYLELELATPAEANREGLITDCFGYYDYEGDPDDPENQDNMLVDFLRSQGLDVKDVFDESKSGSVLDSVRAELDNISSNIDFLTVCGSFDLASAAKLLDGDFSSITINPGSTLGIFDRWNGGGSIFEMEIATPWTVSKSNVDGVYMSSGDKRGYSVADVYGIYPNDTGWYKDTITVN